MCNFVNIPVQQVCPWMQLKNLVFSKHTKIRSFSINNPKFFEKDERGSFAVECVSSDRKSSKRLFYINREVSLQKHQENLIFARNRNYMKIIFFLEKTFRPCKGHV